MHDRARGSVSRVERRLDAAFEIELRRDRIQVGRNDVHHVMRPATACEVAGIDQPADVLDGFAVEGAGAADGLESVELAGIVAAGDHHRAVGRQVHGREIEQGRRDHAEVGDFASGGHQAFDQRVAQTRRAEPAIAAKVDPPPAPALQQRSQGAA